MLVLSYICQKGQVIVLSYIAKVIIIMIAITIFLCIFLLPLGTVSLTF